MEGKKSIKVIGAGFGRTGTNSLKLALEKLGFDPCYHMLEVIQHDHANRWYDIGVGKVTDFETVYAGYQAAVDFPTSGFYKQVMKQYPDAKVILTTRDAESWYQSCEETIFVASDGPPNPRRTLGIRVFMAVIPFFRRFNRMLSKILWEQFFQGRYDKQSIISRFCEHNEDVKRTVPPEKLLVFSVKEGWAPLCEFLDVPVPDEPFPHVNDRQSFKKMYGAWGAAGNAIIAAVGAVGAVAIAVAVRAFLHLAK